MCVYLVKLLCYWYQHQEMIVPSGSCLVCYVFFITGGILTPTLFNIYIYCPSDNLNNSTIRESTGGGGGGAIRFNHMFNVDDPCIINLSSAGLQQILAQCDDYFSKHSFTFNVNKSKCMFFKYNINKKNVIMLICF